jgi:hypothetical protein
LRQRVARHRRSVGNGQPIRRRGARAFPVFSGRRISVDIRLLQRRKFVDRAKNSVDRPSSEFDTQVLELSLCSLPTSTPKRQHRRFWGSFFSVSGFLTRHWHGAVQRSLKLGSWLHLRFLAAGLNIGTRASGPSWLQWQRSSVSPVWRAEGRSIAGWVKAWCCSQRARVSSQTATLNRSHRERSRCGWKTVPPVSVMPARSDASASASESSICGKRSQTTRRRQAPRTIQVRCVRRRDIVARLAQALVQAMTNICGNGHRPASDGSAAW